jgi:uncharacterized protein (DUF1778 family)
MSEIGLVTISLRAPYPDKGMASVLVRMSGRNKQVVSLAAERMGLSQTVFMRLALVRVAERVLQELGITIEYEQNSKVDLSKGETLI